MSRKDTHFLFFSQSINANVILLDGDEVGHIGNVLRFGEGDEIRITDGNGAIFESRIVKLKKDSALCEIISASRVSPFSCGITVAVGLPPKEKLEDICESLTPLGVERIIPLITKNCQKNYADERWEKIAQRCRRKIVSSIKQSLNPYAAKIEQPTELARFASGCELNLLADFGGKRISDIIDKGKTPRSVCLFIGPPAGFSSDEINALSQNCQKVNLAKFRLRTELAAVCAVSAFTQMLTE